MTAAVLPPNHYGVGSIKSFIPHRYPVLLVDRVLAVVPGESITTLKAITCNEPWFEGIPEDCQDSEYAYPTPLLIESWCQSAALLAAWDRDADALAGTVALFGGMSGIEAGGRVLPGDLVRHEVRISRAMADTWFFEGVSTVDGEPVLRVADVMTALRPSAALSPTD
ncbi:MULTISPECIES: 3-hydroxyacyl-ACP dehydratase FabZ family protein [Streptomyces]|uniref:3-hydroxyacyl-ACP dehydratase FabZ family protein n=1 Tax=Streptomyces TaxID=1883 RepID=UPI00163C29F9|nr:MULTISPECIES: 3-hydroxyacyl-ACP dehydratase FabZ family protein [Streptomyces]MBC2875731.1 beta-hydroxyacyl-ACP dehydratase [Streptomyces sp. TYQ1024]UBI37585.1 beta-hydroxyacyl-ACP dehydratase [Streptomyces mobaraensis]UKW30173.1 beta-hydroxyacyl-ACP dehydratase [Streptomyces sp. TYQ1024]